MISSVNSYAMPYQYRVPVFKGDLPQKSDTIDFSEKKELSTTAKVGIGIGALALGAVVCDLVFAKGKHIKSICGKANTSSSTKTVNNASETVANSATSHTNPTPAPSRPKVYTQSEILDKFITPDRAKNLPNFKTFDEAVRDFRLKLSEPNVDMAKNSDELIKSLTPHNYGQDNSFISVRTRTKDIDYTGKTIDITGNKIYRTQLVKTPFDCRRQVDIDSVGDYLIQTLDDGRKLVGISVTSGRFDPRPIRTKIHIVSKDKEFTPLQKDLIEIISQRSKQTADGNPTDILSLGVIARNGHAKHGGGFELNKDVLLSSIATARKQLTIIDNAFVSKALNLGVGERMHQFNF